MIFWANFPSLYLAFISDFRRPVLEILYEATLVR